MSTVQIVSTFRSAAYEQFRGFHDMSRSGEQRERAKRIIYEIIRQAPDDYHKENFLDVAFYYAHLVYHADQSGYLSTWPIVKLPHGPGIEDEIGLLNEIWTTMLSEIAKYAKGAGLTDVEIAAIRWGVDITKKMAITVDSPAWLAASLGEEISIYTDPLPDEEFAKRRGSAEATARALARMWDPISTAASPRVDGPAAADSQEITD